MSTLLQPSSLPIGCAKTPIFSNAAIYYSKMSHDRIWLSSRLKLTLNVCSGHLGLELTLPMFAWIYVTWPYFKFCWQTLTWLQTSSDELKFGEQWTQVYHQSIKEFKFGEQRTQVCSGVCGQICPSSGKFGRTLAAVQWKRFFNKVFWQIHRQISPSLVQTRVCRLQCW